VKRAFAAGIFLLACYAAVFGRVESWIPLSLFLLLGVVGSVAFLARRNPGGLAARIQSQSFGPGTETANTPSKELFRSCRTFSIAFLALASFHGVLIWLSERGANVGRRELALVLALVLILPMTMSFAAGCYLFLRAVLCRFRERSSARTFRRS
jgi:hypothetical protein